MRVAVTGATGLAGYPVSRHLAGLGHEVVTLGRRPVAGLRHLPWQLGERPTLTCDALVHCAFWHVPGRYRGGEGDDPDRFTDLNRDGALALFDALAGSRIVFLSSRAVYGDHRPGTRLTEDTPPRPDTLYGRVKLETEAEVTARGGVSLRATGLYGPPPPGRVHKWEGLFADFAAGRPVGARVGTELLADDLAAAVALCLGATTPAVLNASDLVLDRRDLLAAYGEVSGRSGLLPDRADVGAVNEMDCTRLSELGWQPRGMAGLRLALAEMIRV